MIHQGVVFINIQIKIDLTKVVDTLEKLSLRMSTEEFLNTVLRFLLDILPGFERGHVVLEEDGKGIVVADTGYPVSITGLELEPTKLIEKFTLKPVVFRDIYGEIKKYCSDDTVKLAEYLKYPEIKTAVGFGIEVNGKIVGRFLLESEREIELTEEELKVLHAFAKIASVFISMKLYQERERGYQKGIIHALVKALEARDTYTVGHSERVARYSVEIAKSLGLDRKEIDEIYWGAMIHDIGKLSIPEYILMKPGKLSSHEYEIVKNHTIVGEEMIKGYPWLSTLRKIVRNHHERWNGKGYPDGLKGEKIPLKARIVAVADAYDAMTSDRVYRKRLSVEYALSEIERETGKQFDPEIAKITVETFEKLSNLKS